MTELIAPRTQIVGTELGVSSVALGTYKLGIKSGAAEALELLDHAYSNHGVNFIDTSDNYPGAESLIGLALRDGVLPRDDVVIATKTGLAGSEYEAREFNALGVRNHTPPERIRRKAEDSLRVLGVEAIDLYQLHVHDPDTPAIEIAETMTELTKEGKIRHWGISNYDALQTTQMMAAVERHGLAAPVTSQTYYNMMNRPTEEAVRLAQKLNMTVMAFTPLMKGILSKEGLSGHHEALADIGEAATPEQIFELGIVECIATLSRHADAQGKSLQQLAIAWLMHQPATIPILGTYKQKHFEDLIQAVNWQLTDEDMVAVEDTHARLVDMQLKESK